MTARFRPAGLLVKASIVLALLLLMSVVVDVAHASTSSSPAPVDQPLVNWTWLAVGLGGVAVMLVVMFLLTRVFGSRRREDE